MLKLMFSFHGRIGVGKFWLSLLVKWLFTIVSFVALITVFTLDLETGAAKNKLGPVAATAVMIGSIAIFLVFSVMQFATMVKRCHDRNKPGWYSLLSLIPLAGFVWWVIDLGILSGHPGRNQYGPDPRGGEAHPVTAGFASDSDRFHELKTLADNGLISEAEFRNRKRKLLGV